MWACCILLLFLVSFTVTCHNQAPEPRVTTQAVQKPVSAVKAFPPFTPVPIPPRKRKRKASAARPLRRSTRKRHCSTRDCPCVTLFKPVPVLAVSQPGPLPHLLTGCMAHQESTSPFRPVCVSDLALSDSLAPRRPS